MSNEHDSGSVLPRNTLPPPLAGMRILSIEQYGAGPFATMLLADLGADVIKVEDVSIGGDVARAVPPFVGHNDSLFFQSLNRGKRSLALDTRTPRGAELLRALVPHVDVVFNNLRGDQAIKRRLCYPDFADLKPSIVCCHLSGFGRVGPRASEPGYDYLMQGYAGWMSVTGNPDGPPEKSGLSLVDMSTSLFAVAGLLSAVLRARDTGIGGDVDVSLFDSALALLNYLACWHLTEGYQPRRYAYSSHPSLVPSQIFPTSDGWLVVMCAKEKFYRELVEIAGSPALADDPRFCNFTARLENRDVLIGILLDLFQKGSTTEWMTLLQGRVPCAPVNTIEQALMDPQAIADGMIVSFEHPQFGTVRQVGNPVKVSGASVPVTPGPALGEHSADILRELLGLDDATIAELKQDEVILW